MMRIRYFFAGLAALCWAVAVWAQGGATVYPERPVRLVVPFPAGGGTDILAGALSQQLSEAIGQPVVIDNRGGAGGTIGSALVPELPTVAESGLPGFEASSWYGLLAPAGMPPAIVVSLYKQVVRVLRSPQVQSRFSGEGAEPIGNTSEEFARKIRADIAKWARVVRASGARAN